MRNKALKRESTSLRPTIWIGKGGVDQNIIDQVKTQIKAKHLIKIKVQQPAYNQDNLEKIIHQVIEKANVILIDTRGRTFIVAKS